ncbi:MAG: pyridoxal-phosphate dependent enzyme [Bacteroidales bacterium]|nr:pyridoxal-phosphate dependent enzyme [Bacteroidales bacterium]
MTSIPTRKDILSASKIIEPYVHRTPVLSSENLNHLLDCQLFFKCENLQKAGAFKSRGAVNAVFTMDADLMKNGVATHSSGNHAAALSRAAKLRGIKAHIVMPENSSAVKIEAVKHYGGNITFCKSNLASREETLKLVLKHTNATEVHPYNNPTIISGQATAAKELCEDSGAFDIIMAPVGGGGLLSGTALAVNYFSPKTIVIAAEPEQADDAYQSFYQKKFIPSLNPDTIADGLRTSLGSLTFPIIQKYVNDIVTVSEVAIIRAMKLIWERMKIIVEPSSAVPLAAILENKFEYKNKKIGIIISGGNVDLDNLPW